MKLTLIARCREVSRVRVDPRWDRGGLGLGNGGEKNKTRYGSLAQEEKRKEQRIDIEWMEAICTMRYIKKHQTIYNGGRVGRTKRL